MEKYDELERTYILHAVALLFNIKYPENLLDSLDSQRRRARMFLSLRRLIGAASQKGAGVIVVNDIHWADHSTLEFFSDMVSEKRKRPMVVVLTARPNPDVVTGRFWSKLTTGDNVLVHQVDDLQPRAARALIDQAHERSRQLLQEHREALDALANALLEKEVLEEEELRDILAGFGIDVPVRQYRGAGEPPQAESKDSEEAGEEPAQSAEGGGADGD